MILLSAELRKFLSLGNQAGSAKSKMGQNYIRLHFEINKIYGNERKLYYRDFI